MALWRRGGAFPAESGISKAQGFAVVDVETTGLYPTKDRVVEVAIVQVSAEGLVTEKFCTLIDPQRDIGPTHIHGLTASSILGAPTFSQAAPAVWERLSGRVFVAHNASFDLLFLQNELARVGLKLPDLPVECTMRLSGRYLSPLPARTLTACCDAAGVTLENHHSALDDAVAAANLLAYYRGSNELPGPWAENLERAATTTWLSLPRASDFRAVTRDDQSLRQRRDRPPLADLVDRLPRGDGGDVDHYLGVLDRLLEDRLLTTVEVAELSEVAEALGLHQAAAARAHREYVDHLATLIWSDGVASEAETKDLLAVAGMLSIPSQEALAILQGAQVGTVNTSPIEVGLKRGDHIAFTGDMDLPRSELEARAESVGLRVMTSVSARTALLVIADPNSQSAKAKSARANGIRIVTEQLFLHLVERLDREAGDF